MGQLYLVMLPVTQQRDRGTYLITQPHDVLTQTTYRDHEGQLRAVLLYDTVVDRDTVDADG